MKRSSSADRASTPRRTPSIQPFNNVLPARARSASLGLDVRCGCQFFGTDSLLPERQALMAIGRPKTRPTSPKFNNQSAVGTTIKRKTLVSSARSFSSVGDHEYELVMPPPPALRVTGPTYDRYEPELGTAPKREGSQSSTESRDRKERKFLRIPLDDEMQGLPNDGEGSEDEVMGVEEKDEGPGFDRAAAVPSPGTTTGSRTDLELNTSQVDSSALEDLPLSREARRQQRLEQQAEDKGPGAAARSLQRIRSHAGRLRTKIRNIKRPNINLPERPRFSMPERPKFNLPERPKFNLPERPKFNFPDRPKFNLPARPKFNLPERPKFNLPERPKFNLPDRPKFNFPSFSLPRTRRPLRERQQHQESGSSLEVPDQELQDVHLDTPAPSTPGKRNYFDFRTYPRLFDRYKTSRQQRDNIPPQRTARHITPPIMRYEDGDDEMDMEMDEEPARKPKLPPRRRSSGGTQQQARWVGKFTELEYADSENLAPIMAARTNGTAAPFDDEDDDEEMQALERELQAGDTEEEHSESLSGFRDKDFGYAVTLAQGHQPPAPPMIFPDDEEISLQESERDVAHSSGSSSDRRRAGVLEEIDSDEFFLREKGLSQEDIDVGRYLSNEIRDAFRHPVPETDNTILLENATLNEAELARTYRGTPERVVTNKTRPPRRFKTTKQRGSRSPPVVPEVVVEEHFFNTFPPNKPTRNRRRQLREQQKQRNEETTTLGRQSYHVPTAPRRKKRTRSEFVLGDNASQWSEDLNPEWLQTVESQVVTNEVNSGVMVAMMRSEPVEHEYIIPPAPTAPTAPKRGRRQNRQQAPSPSTPAVQEAPIKNNEYLEDDQPEPGYAYVVKPGIIEIEIVDKTPEQYVIAPCTPPPRRMKPGNRPPFPSIRRRRNRPLSGSFTVPHRRGPPTRPSRNYATLGPSRPPRKHHRRSLEDLSNRDLQSGAVIQKMKERPLPPPPRPSRRNREMVEDEVQLEEEESNIIPTEELELQTQPDDEMIEPDDIVQHIIKLSASSEIIHEVQKIASPITTPEPPPIEESLEEEILISSQVNSSKTSSQDNTKGTSENIFTETTVTEDKNAMAAPETEKGPGFDQVAALPSPGTTTGSRTDLELNTIQTRDEATRQNEFLQTSEPVNEFRDVPIRAEQLECEDIPTCLTASSISEGSMKEEQQGISQNEYDEPKIMSESVSTEVTEDCFIPVEEVCVSTQTDPIPEEELLKLEMEREEVCSTQTPVQPVAPPPPPATQTQPELSPATVALLQALNAGQLRLELLDVTRLNVNELQAQKLLVSDIDGMTLNVNELQSSGGSLVVNSLDAPLGSLTEALMAAAQQLIPPPKPDPVPVPSTSTSTQCDPEPVAPPQETQRLTIQEIPQQVSPPVLPVESRDTEHVSSEVVPTPIQAAISDTPVEVVTSHTDETTISEGQVVQPFSTPRASPGPSYYQTPVFTTEQVVALQAAMSTMPRESSLPPLSEWQPPPQRYRQQEVEPGILELGNRLARACCTATLAALRRVVSYTQVNSESTGEAGERGGLQVALCIVLVLVAGLILIGIGGSGGEVHHHHWDFYMPK